MIDENITFAHINKRLDERRIELQDFIAQGSLKDFNEYHKLCGVIQGLTFAKETITGLAKRLETNDDE